MKFILFEMAERRKEIARWLSSNSMPVMEHLVKYLCVNDKDMREHWIDEIYGFLHTVDLIKGSNKYPTKEFIVDNTYGKHADSICLKRNKILKKYNDSTLVELSDEKLLDFILYYFQHLSEYLSYDGYVSEDEVRDILTSYK